MSLVERLGRITPNLHSTYGYRYRTSSLESDLIRSLQLSQTVDLASIASYSFSKTFTFDRVYHFVTTSINFYHPGVSRLSSPWIELAAKAIFSDSFILVLKLLLLLSYDYFETSLQYDILLVQHQDHALM